MKAWAVVDAGVPLRKSNFRRRNRLAMKWWWKSPIARAPFGPPFLEGRIQHGRRQGDEACRTRGPAAARAWP